MWQEPKTDWTKSDRHSVVDYNRQAGNIEHIADVVLPSLAYHTPEPVEIAPVARSDKPVAARFNALEDGLTAIAASGVPLPPELQPSKTWLPGEAAPDYTDANRWEGNVLAVYEMAERVAVRWRPAGTFAAGQTNILPRRVI